MSFLNEEEDDPAKRPAGVTLVAALLTCFSLLAGIFVLILAVNTYGGPQSDGFGRERQFFGEIFLYLLATLVVASGTIAIGLFNGREWARVGAVIFGCLPVLAAVKSGFHLQLLGFLVLLVEALCGASLAIYLSQEEVRLYFQNAAGTSPEGVLVRRLPEPRAPHWTRIGVLVLGACLLFNAWFLLGWTVIRFPLLTAFGNYRGLPAALAGIVGIALNLFLAGGLYRRFLPAYYVALAFEGLSAIATLLSILGWDSLPFGSFAPGFSAASFLLALALKLVFHLRPQQAHFGAPALLSLAVSGVFLYVLALQLANIQSQRKAQQL